VSECVFTGPLSSTGHGADHTENILLSEFVFIDPLLSTGHGVDHIENTSFNTFSIVACAYFGRCLEMGLHVTIPKPLLGNNRKPTRLHSNESKRNNRGTVGNGFDGGPRRGFIRSSGFS
jgi:hypothetical protein